MDSIPKTSDADEAARQLKQVETANLATQRDRTLYGWETAASVTLFSTLAVVTRNLESILTSILVWSAFIGAAYAIDELFKRQKRALPRHTKRLTMGAVVGCLLVALVVVFPIFNYREQTQSVPILMQLAGIAAIALPGWIVALVVANAKDRT